MGRVEWLRLTDCSMSAEADKSTMTYPYSEGNTVHDVRAWNYDNSAVHDVLPNQDTIIEQWTEV